MRTVLDHFDHWFDLICVDREVVEPDLNDRDLLSELLKIRDVKRVHTATNHQPPDPNVSEIDPLEEITTPITLSIAWQYELRGGEQGEKVGAFLVVAECTINCRYVLKTQPGDKNGMC